MNGLDDFIDRIKADMNKRRKALEDDLLVNVPLEDRIVSDRLAKVKGMQEYLAQAKMRRAVYENQHVTDQRSHAVVTKADLHRRYTGGT